MTDRQKLLPTSRLVTAIHFISVDSFQDAYQRMYLFHIFPGSCTWSLCIAALLNNELFFFFSFDLFNLLYHFSLECSVYEMFCTVLEAEVAVSSQNGESTGGSSVTFPVLLPGGFLIWGEQLEKRSFVTLPMQRLVPFEVAAKQFQLSGVCFLECQHSFLKNCLTSGGGQGFDGEL